MADGIPGKNMEPMHPWCLCTTMPWDEDMEALLADETRWAKDPETGEVIEVPASMTYSEWKKISVSAGVTPADQYGAAVTDVYDTYKQSVIDMLDNAPQDVRDVWAKYKDDMLPPEYTVDPKEGEAYYSRLDKKVHFINAQKAHCKTRYQEENTCYFHERWHNIDHLAGGGKLLDRSFSAKYNGGIFAKTLHEEIEDNLRAFYLQENKHANLWWEKDGFDFILARGSQPGGSITQELHSYLMAAKPSMSKADYIDLKNMIYDAANDTEALRNLWDRQLSKNAQIMKDFSNDKKATMDYWKRKTYLTANNAQGLAKEIRNTYNDYARADVSDMFEGYLCPELGLHGAMGYGHEIGYYGKKGAIDYDAVSKEAAAEMFSATVTKNQSLKTIQIHFPRSYDVFLQMLGAMK